MADYKQGAHKGKVKSITATGNPYGDGERKTWYYGMEVDCDGKIVEGQVGFKSETPKVKAGDVINFDKELDSKDRLKFKNVKIVSDNKGPSGAGPALSTYNDPILIKRSALGQAQRLALMTFTMMNEGKTLPEMEFPKSFASIDALAKKYNEWIIKVEPLTRDDISARVYCLDKALTMKNYVGIDIGVEGKTGINSSSDILLVAQHFYDQQMLIVAPKDEPAPL